MQDIQDVDTDHDALPRAHTVGHRPAGALRVAQAMTATDPFALQKSGLNDLLFAEIGTEPSGMPLSLLSALARLGQDPWQEAQRIADLPGHLAVSGLAGLIAASGAQHGPEAMGVAEKLVKLLPGEHRTPPKAASAPPWSRGERILQSAAVLVAIALTATMLVSGDLTHPATVSAPAAAQGPAGVPAPATAPPDPAQVPTAE